MKKLLCILLCLFLFAAPCALASEEGNAISFWDINEDNKENATDALWVLQYLVGKRELTPQQMANADVDYLYYGDENRKGVTPMDALLILQRSTRSGPFSPSNLFPDLPNG